MKRSWWIGLLVAVAGLLVASTVGMASTARTKRFKTNLSTREEVPSPKNVSRRADGKFTAELDGKVLTWKLTYDHLSGKATAAHIHVGAKRKAGPVLIPLCGPCTSGITRKIKLTAAQVSALTEKRTYVNVHTVKNPAGEVRGQLR